MTAPTLEGLKILREASERLVPPERSYTLEEISIPISQSREMHEAFAKRWIDSILGPGYYDKLYGSPCNKPKPISVFED